MMLNKYVVAFGFVASLVTVPGMALAAGNTISFQGEVADETCEVSVNGSNAAPIILLPTVSASQLKSAGQTAGQTTFDIGVSDCTGDADGMKISTVFVGNQVTSTGNLGNTGTAGNVELQVLDTKGKEINFTGGFTGEGDLELAPNATSANVSYTAQYLATGAATPGSVTSTLQYAISYQ